MDDGSGAVSSGSSPDLLYDLLQDLVAAFISLTK